MKEEVEKIDWVTTGVTNTCFILITGSIVFLCFRLIDMIDTFATEEMNLLATLIICFAVIKLVTLFIMKSILWKGNGKLVLR